MWGVIMAFSYDERGDIELIQGDSGEIPFEDLPTDKNYKVYFSIYDSNRDIIGSEISFYSNYEPVVRVSIPAILTDLLEVSRYSDYQEYYYGVKICDEATNWEDTLLIGDKDIGEPNIITVYPKRTEGLTTEVST